MMGKNSFIEWTTHTWNPWQGCRKVSAGCANCYMYREKKQYGQDPTTVVRSKPATFNKPLSWKEPARVFVCSWSDFFIEDADPWRDEAWDIIRQTPHLTYQILTKRPENIPGRLPEDWGTGWSHVWPGVSVENQDHKNRIRQLLVMPGEPYLTYWVSAEPLLGPLDLRLYLTDQCGYYCDPPPLDFYLENPDVEPYPWDGHHDHIWEHLKWVVIGGESDFHNPRPMGLDWVRDLIAQCRAARVSVFVKQLGTHWARNAKMPDEQTVYQSGDHHGRNPGYWPEDLRIREFPGTPRLDAN